MLDGLKSLLTSTTTAVESVFRYLMGNAYRTGAAVASAFTMGEVRSKSESVCDRVNTSRAEISVPQVVQPDELRIKDERITRLPIRESGNSIQYLLPSL